MIFMPEPIRNETNRIAAEEAIKALEFEERFDHLEHSKVEEDASKMEKVSL